MATFSEHLAQRRYVEKNGARLVPLHIETLQAYQPGRPLAQVKQELGIDKLVNLASNENPLGPPQTALEAINKVSAEIHRYPESGGFELREMLAEKYKVNLENVAIGSGSEGIMANVIRAFLQGDDEVVTSEGTFVGFCVLVKAQGVQLKQVALKNYHYDLEGIAAAINQKTKIVYLCNPNNPTGTIIPKHQLEPFLRSVPEHVLVILDEAYFEYAAASPEFLDSMNYRYDNVLTLRTFSKVYGMAGIRLGYALGHPYLISFVNKVRLPFEPSSLAQAAGVAALNDRQYLGQSLSNNKAGMKQLRDEFKYLGLSYVESFGNFVMVPFETQEKVALLHEGLLREGIAIRPLKAFGLPHCFRVTVGLPEENAAFIQVLRHCL